VEPPAEQPSSETSGTAQSDGPPAEPDGVIAASRPAQVTFAVIGTISLAIGVVGIVVPVLPTTPFLLLAAACYARASTRLYGWLLGQPGLGPIIVEWRRSRSLAPGVKARAVVADVRLSIIPSTVRSSGGLLRSRSSRWPSSFDPDAVLTGGVVEPRSGLTSRIPTPFGPEGPLEPHRCRDRRRPSSRRRSLRCLQGPLPKYNNLGPSYRKRKLGEVVSRSGRRRSGCVEATFRDVSAASRDPWSGVRTRKTCTAAGRARVARLRVRLTALRKGGPSSGALEGNEVTLHGWSTLYDIEAAPMTATGTELFPAVTHQLPVEDLRLLDQLLERAPR
jgi:hypothetical protein